MDEPLKVALTVSVSKQTRDFLDSLKTEEQANVSAWVEEAIRRRAGLSPNGEPVKKGKRV